MRRAVTLIILFLAVFTLCGMNGAEAALDYAVDGPAFAAFPVAGLSSGAGTDEVFQKADGYEAAKLVISAETINFGTVKAGETSAPVTVTLTNTGSADVMAVMLETTGGFTLSAAYPFEPVLIKAGDSGSITLAYEDAGGEEKLSGFLYIRTFGGENETLVIPMAVNGAAPPVLPEAEKLPSQNIGETAGPCFIGISGR